MTTTEKILGKKAVSPPKPGGANAKQESTETSFTIVNSEIAQKTTDDEFEKYVVGTRNCSDGFMVEATEQHFVETREMCETDLVSFMRISGDVATPKA